MLLHAAGGRLEPAGLTTARTIGMSDKISVIALNGGFGSKQSRAMRFRRCPDGTLAPVFGPAHQRAVRNPRHHGSHRFINLFDRIGPVSRENGI
jgi:hypothetical protein